MLSPWSWSELPRIEMDFGAKVEIHGPDGQKLAGRERFQEQAFNQVANGVVFLLRLQPLESPVIWPTGKVQFDEIVAEREQVVVERP